MSDASIDPQQAAINQALHRKNFQERQTFIQNQNQYVWSRMCMLFQLQELQIQHKGELPKGTFFIHLNSPRVFNVRKIGFIDMWSFVVPLEVYEHLTVKSGVVWITADSVSWIGCTDQTLVPDGITGFGTRTSPHEELNFTAEAARIIAGLREPKDVAQAK